MEADKTIFFDKDRLCELLNRLTQYEKSMKDERRKLWHNENELEDEYVVWDRLEVLSTYIAGYVSQIASQGYTRQEPREVISHLQKLSIFDVECIMKWYPSAEEEYPKIKQYFELLDYIRLLTLEYIERYRLQELVQE